MQRYALIKQVGDLTLAERLLDHLPPEAVRLKIAYCGICATDLAILEGKRSKSLPYSPGHEYSGIVEAVGTNVRGFAPGDHVVGNPNFVCGQCYFCRQGEYNLCENADTPHYSNGAFATTMVIDSQYVHRLPAQLSLRDAALTECLACTLHAVEYLAPLEQKLVLVIGAGTMGLLMTEVLRNLKRTETIIVSDLSPERRAMAATLGADHVVDGDPDVLQQMTRSYHAPGADTIFECAGSLAAVLNAFACTRRGGRIVMVGRTAEDALLPLQPGKLARNELSLQGTARYLPRHFEQAIGWLADGKITSEAYFSRTFALNEIVQAFQFARSGHGIKTLVTGTYQ